MFGRRFVIVGDSLGRNQFISILCMASVGINTTRVYEKAGGEIRVTKQQPTVIMVFEEFNFTIEYYRSHFLVSTSHVLKRSRENVTSLILVDQLDFSWTSKVKDADIILFNVGHWLTKGKTFDKGACFGVKHTCRPEIDEVMGYELVIQSLAKWVDKLSRSRTQFFFRGYSPAHFRNNDWRTARCLDNFSPPGKIEEEYLYFGQATLKSISKMQHPMTFMDILPLSSERGDGHIGKMLTRNLFDCSHWCLPGVPDIWNELLYGSLLAIGKPPFN